MKAIKLNWTEGAYAARLVAAAMLALFVSKLLTGNHGFSAVISALIVVRPYQQGALKAGAMRLLATLIGVALAFGALLLRHFGLNDYVRLLLALVPLSLLVAYDSAYRSALIAAVLIMAAPAGHEGEAMGVVSAVDVALWRAAVVAIGAVIGIGVSVLVLPQPHQQVVAQKAVTVLAQLITGLRDSLSAQPSVKSEKAEGKLRKALMELGQMHRDNGKSHVEGDPSGQIVGLVRHAQAVCLVLRSHWRREAGDIAAREAYCVALLALIEAQATALRTRQPIPETVVQAVWQSIPEVKGAEVWMVRTLAGNIVRLGEV